MYIFSFYAHGEGSSECSCAMMEWTRRMHSVMVVMHHCCIWCTLLLNGDGDSSLPERVHHIIPEHWNPKNAFHMPMTDDFWFLTISLLSYLRDQVLLPIRAVCRGFSFILRFLWSFFVGLSLFAIANKLAELFRVRWIINIGNKAEKWEIRHQHPIELSIERIENSKSKLITR